MNGSDVLEDRLREAFARRAATTTVGEPPTAPAATTVELAPLGRPAVRRRRPVLAVAGATLAAAAAVLAWALVVDDGVEPAPVATDGTAGTTGEAATVVEYEATTLPAGYTRLDRNDIGGDVDDEVVPQRFGTNCMDWHVDDGEPVCERIATVRSRHYGPAGMTGVGVTVTTFVDAPLPPIPATAVETDPVKGAPAVLDPGSAITGPLLSFEPEEGVVIFLDGLDPSVTEDDLRTIAEGLQPTEAPAPDDLGYAVARLDAEPDTGAADGPRTFYLWDRPAPASCLGGLLDNMMVPCQPRPPTGVMASLGNTDSAAIGGVVSATVDRVEIETAGGEPIRAELTDPGAPFTDRVFLTPVGDRRPTAVVAFDAAGRELERHPLS